MLVFIFHQGSDLYPQFQIAVQSRRHRRAVISSPRLVKSDRRSKQRQRVFAVVVLGAFQQTFGYLNIGVDQAADGDLAERTGYLKGFGNDIIGKFKQIVLYRRGNDRVFAFDQGFTGDPHL